MPIQDNHGLGAGVEVEFEPNVTPAAPTEEGVVGAAQRLRIRVPNVYTQLTLGQSVADEDSQGFAYPGFGAETDGHVFVNAKGGKDKSKMSLQANGQILIQTDNDSLYCISAGPAVVATPKAANIAGGGGVNIIAGWGAGVSNPSCDATSPNAPAAITDLPAEHQKVADLWGYVDSAMGGLGILGAVIQERLAATKPTWATGMFNLGNAANLGNIANNNFGVAGIDHPLGGGVTVHGMGGWVLGTPSYGSAYAALGLTIGSAFPAMMGLVDSSVVATRNVGVFAGHEASLSARNTVTVLAGDKLELASRGSKGTAVKGERIALGSAAGDGRQRATKELTGNATNLVAFASKQQMTLTGFHIDVTGKDGASLTADKVAIGNGSKLGMHAEGVGITAKDFISMATEKFMLCITDSEVTLGNVSQPIPPPPVKGPSPAQLQQELAELAMDPSFKADMKEARAEENKEYQKKVEDWLNEAIKIVEKDVSIKLKTGAIELDVKGALLKIDSGKMKAFNSLEVKK